MTLRNKKNYYAVHINSKTKNKKKHPIWNIKNPSKQKSIEGWYKELMHGSAFLRLQRDAYPETLFKDTPIFHSPITWTWEYFWLLTVGRTNIQSKMKGNEWLILQELNWNVLDGTPREKTLLRRIGQKNEWMRERSNWGARQVTALTILTSTWTPYTPQGWEEAWINLLQKASGWHVWTLSLSLIDTSNWKFSML